MSSYDKQPKDVLSKILYYIDQVNSIKPKYPIVKYITIHTVTEEDKNRLYEFSQVCNTDKYTRFVCDDVYKILYTRNYFDEKVFPDKDFQHNFIYLFNRKSSLVNRYEFEAAVEWLMMLGARVVKSDIKHENKLFIPYIDGYDIKTKVSINTIYTVDDIDYSKESNLLEVPFSLLYGLIVDNYLDYEYVVYMDWLHPFDKD